MITESPPVNSELSEIKNTSSSLKSCEYPALKELIANRGDVFDITDNRKPVKFIAATDQVGLLQRIFISRRSYCK